jgi:phosphatidylserine decarboxylase
MSPKVALQYLLPHRLLSAGMRALMHWRWSPWKNAVIGVMTRLYAIDVAEAADPDPAAYPHFNAFFTRALRPGARPLDADPEALLVPADGRISQAGPIRAGRIFQAKGHDYSAAELLGDEAAAQVFADGSYATVYLSPRDYHRVHMPLAGRLRATLHVPGRLFSVAPFTVEAVPRLVARNERLVCHFDTALGPVAVVMVGALLVSGVETVWRGVEIPPYGHGNRILRRDYADRHPAIDLARGAEMARFNMGSTVIVLLPAGVELAPGLAPGAAVRLGQRLAQRPRSADGRTVDGTGT